MRFSSGCEQLNDRTALSELGKVLDGLSIRWALIGALAANRYRSSPRLTQDVDLLLADTGPGLEALEAALGAAGWSVRRADESGELLRLTHPELGTADLLISGTDYQQQAIRRAATEKITDTDVVRVLTIEDVIVHKLIAGRHQDLADIDAILETGLRMDEAYIERWARHWDVLERWTTFKSS